MDGGKVFSDPCRSDGSSFDEWLRTSTDLLEGRESLISALAELSAGELAEAIRRTVDAVWRMEAATIIATLTPMVVDVGCARGFGAGGADAVVGVGCPAESGRLAHHVAKRRAVDGWCRQERLDGETRCRWPATTIRRRRFADPAGRPRPQPVGPY